MLGKTLNLGGYGVELIFKKHGIQSNGTWSEGWNLHLHSLQYNIQCCRKLLNICGSNLLNGDW